MPLAMDPGLQVPGMGTAGAQPHLRIWPTRRPGRGHPRAQRDGTTENRIHPEPVTRPEADRFWHLG
jgi:hypothetical protein